MSKFISVQPPVMVLLKLNRSLLIKKLDFLWFTLLPIVVVAIPWSLAVSLLFCIICLFLFFRWMEDRPFIYFSIDNMVYRHCRCDHIGIWFISHKLCFITVSPKQQNRNATHTNHLIVWYCLFRLATCCTPNILIYLRHLTYYMSYN